jgi:NADH-quinone oxidoreductase subunit F
LEIGEYDLSGRRIRRGTGSIRSLACDTVIVAIGERVDTELLETEKLAVSKRGHLEVKPYLYETNQEHVWAIGDVINGPSTAAEAMGQGKEVARLIDRRLSGEDRFAQLFTTFSYEQTVGKTLYEGKAINAEKLPVAARSGSFEEVNKGYTGRQARMEAGRCLRCDVKCEQEVLYG